LKGASQNQTLPPEMIGMWKYVGVRIFQAQTITNRGFPFPPQITGGTCIGKTGGVLDVHPDGTYSFREELVRNCPIPPGTISNPVFDREMENMKKPVPSHGKGFLRQSPDGSWQLLATFRQIPIPVAKIEMITGPHCPILRISGINLPFEDVAFQTKKEHFSDKDLIKMASFANPNP
jgi:hypothetical protein